MRIVLSRLHSQWMTLHIFLYIWLLIIHFIIIGLINPIKCQLNISSRSTTRGKWSSRPSCVHYISRMYYWVWKEYMMLAGLRIFIFFWWCLLYYSWSRRTGRNLLLRDEVIVFDSNVIWIVYMMITILMMMILMIILLLLIALRALCNLSGKCFLFFQSCCDSHLSSYLTISI